jgi:hypothetical protein
MVDGMLWVETKISLLELLERSVRGEALAQSNSASIPDFVVVQTAKPQKKKKKKLCQISQNIAVPRSMLWWMLLWWMSCGRCYRGCHAAGSGENQLAVDVIVGVMVG